MMFLYSAWFSATSRQFALIVLGQELLKIRYS